MRMLKNMKKPGLTLILIFLIAVCLILTIPGIVKSSRDQTPPEIKFADETRELSVTEYLAVRSGDYTCLLTDVSATDVVDGDVNDHTIVLRFNESSDSNFAVAVYSSVDSNLNETRVRRIFYLPSQNAIAAALLEESNSDNKTEALRPEIPVLKLTTNIVTIKPGGEVPDYVHYIKELHDDKDSVESLLRNIHVIGKVSFATPGSYIIYIYVEDSDGNISEPQGICINVEK